MVNMVNLKEVCFGVVELDATQCAAAQRCAPARAASSDSFQFSQEDTKFLNKYEMARGKLSRKRGGGRKAMTTGGKTNASGGGGKIIVSGVGSGGGHLVESWKEKTVFGNVGENVVVMPQKDSEFGQAVRHLNQQQIPVKVPVTTPLSRTPKPVTSTTCVKGPKMIESKLYIHEETGERELSMPEETEDLGQRQLVRSPAQYDMTDRSAYMAPSGGSSDNYVKEYYFGDSSGGSFGGGSGGTENTNNNGGGGKLMAGGLSGGAQINKNGGGGHQIIATQKQTGLANHQIGNQNQWKQKSKVAVTINPR